MSDPVRPPAAPVRDDKQLERSQDLHVNAALKSAIFDHSLNAMVSTDEDGIIVEFNPAAQALFGHTRDDVLGRAISEVVIPQRYRAAHDAGLSRLRQGGESHVLGMRLKVDALRSDGSEIPIEMALWRTKVGDAVFYTASIVDLTERHTTDALRQSEKLTAMGGLLAGVAHELNNPLAIAMGRASLLEEKCVDAEIKADARRIREATERCGRIVRTFLNMARGKPPQRAAVNLNDLVSAASEMLHYTFRTHGIELEIQLDGNLPAAFVDADQISQVVVNLLVNAHQALDETDYPRRIAIETGTALARDGMRQVWLRVSDSGLGIAPEVLPCIFEPFVTTKAEGIGTGLGLPVSRSLARVNRGDLTIEAPGRLSGAAFLLTLPATGQAPSAHAQPPAESQAQAPTAARVLVVDDEAELVDLMRDLLEAAGYEVVCAGSAALAFELLGAARFDAVISDLRMPDMDGAIFWQEIRMRHPSLALRTMFVTGDTLSASAREFLKAARCPSLDKPFSKNDLLSGLKRLLEGSA